ncbi:hypothetical protein HanRHA438_Chr05g0234881 [Helianthus annuus]|nr:hypothetical protein HanRHA438_Chr05g0234881 [Helianthus annuus]
MCLRQSTNITSYINKPYNRLLAMAQLLGEQPTGHTSTLNANWNCLNPYHLFQRPKSFVSSIAERQTNFIEDFIKTSVKA